MQEKKKKEVIIILRPPLTFLHENHFSPPTLQRKKKDWSEIFKAMEVAKLNPTFLLDLFSSQPTSCLEKKNKNKIKP